MKKLLAALLIAALAVTLISCGSSGGNTSGTEDTAQYTPGPLSTNTAKPVSPVDPNADTTSADPHTDPVVTDPVVTDPVVTDPVVTDPTPDTTKATDPVDPTPDTTADPNEGCDPVPADPQPVASDINVSGTVQKDLARGLTACLDYTATQAAGSTELNVTLTLRMKYYTMYKNPSKGMLTVNGQQAELLSEPIDHLEMGERQETVIGTASFKLDHYEGQKITLNMKGSWYYGGVYSDVNFEFITVDGTEIVK